MSKSITSFIEAVAKKNPNEPEFMQAVMEVAETVFHLSKKIENTKTRCFWKGWSSQIESLFFG